MAKLASSNENELRKYQGQTKMVGLDQVVGNSEDKCAEYL